jgi:hypothetical protein
MGFTADEEMQLVIHRYIATEKTDEQQETATQVERRLRCGFTSSPPFVLSLSKGLVQPLMLVDLSTSADAAGLKAHRRARHLYRNRVAIFLCEQGVLARGGHFLCEAKLRDHHTCRKVSAPHFGALRANLSWRLPAGVQQTRCTQTAAGPEPAATHHRRPSLDRVGVQELSGPSLRLASCIVPFPGADRVMVGSEC